MEFDLPVGYHDLHKIKIIDYQLNRWHSSGYFRLADCIDAAKKIRGLDDFKPEMVRQAQRALREDRMVNAAFHYRAAEFFTGPEDPDKQSLYRRFQDLFYDHLFWEDIFTKHLIPFMGKYLPALRLKPKKGNGKVLLIHGGFDSFKEEFLSWGLFFYRQGYEVIIFEGPGQGEALKEYGLFLSYKWELVLRAVLDYFGLDDVALLGISMGGWLCFRAAAFEDRIKKVIASSVVFDYLQIPPPFLARLVKRLLRHPKLLDWMSGIQNRVSPQERWGVNNLMYITNKKTPSEASLEILKLNEENLQSERVKQDVLVLTGSEDHFIPLKMHYKQLDALKNARSLTGRIFTRKESAQNHCQVGNIGLALTVMSSWLESH
jgi:pimeloyl-ACP methyl ester carboxylesterase